MTELKKYNLTKEAKETVLDYIRTSLDFASVDYRMYDYLLANSGNTDHAIAMKPNLLSFLVDVVYTAVMHIEYAHNDVYFESLDKFKQEYYIEFASVVYIVDLVLIHFHNLYNGTNS